MSKPHSKIDRNVKMLVNFQNVFRKKKYFTNKQKNVNFSTSFTLLVLSLHSVRA